ncbi:hypothetical protein [Microbulbifer halophilus]|uniref:Uncharacterized protein n=1 Tax=Microbulbifer halophilus TaxID=453963 RepID=A0ABW5EEE8_9GAMM|nr:hypothetical protein [Microbulbifer halophilus]MCW8127882.1 hypothetical protein [Microbulbifer halophilus]
MKVSPAKSCEQAGLNGGWTFPERALVLPLYGNVKHRLEIVARDPLVHREDKDSLNLGIALDVCEQLAEHGIEIATVGVKDVILPGDMKQILTRWWKPRRSPKPT